MSYIKKILMVVALLGLVFCGIKVYGIVQSFSGSNTAFNNEEAYIYIPSKTDRNTLKNELFPLIKDVESFKQVASRLGYNQMKAGKYTIKKGMSNLDIVRTLKAESDIVKVELPSRKEILSIKTIARNIATHIEATENELYNVIVDTVYPVSKGYELTELPYIYGENTYAIPWNTSAEEFRAIVYKAYEKSKKQ
ncbi:endolytic transglycosylase MltG [Kordia sp.]|uniref:endolytic transglycosylase MltG n=1 Tax=Kordia sp. TaxID=1965332 RepID=UPI003B59CAD1